MLSPSLVGRDLGADALKVIAIILVVFLHAGNELPASFASHDFNFQSGALLFEQLISNGVSRVAVPIFFFISGYLASRQWAVRGYIYRSDVIKRFKSIFVPYLLWNITVMVLYFLVQIPEFSHRYFNNGLIHDKSFAELMTIIFVAPVPYQLWFLRDLFVLFIFAPILLLLVKKASLFFFFLILITWLTNINCFISTEGVLFFSFGLYVGLGIRIFSFVIPLRLSVMIWLIVAAISVWLKLINFPEWILFVKLQILLGSIVMVNVADRGAFNNFARYSIYTFPIFIFHEPTLTFLKKITLILIPIPRSAGYDILAYLLSPIVSILISILVVKLLIRWLPWVYTIIVGGRASEKHSQSL